jgi:hypothetical protein
VNKSFFVQGAKFSMLSILRNLLLQNNVPKIRRVDLAALIRTPMTRTGRRNQPTRVCRMIDTPKEMTTST